MRHMIKLKFDRRLFKNAPVSAKLVYKLPIAIVGVTYFKAILKLKFKFKRLSLLKLKHIKKGACIPKL